MKIGNANSIIKNSKAYRQSLSIRAKENGFGGKRNSKRFYYKNICLDSSYEVKIAKDLDKNNILWTRPAHFLWRDGTGEQHRYYPDFYLPKFNVYLDPKNDYLIKKDKNKIKRVAEQNNIKLYVLNKNELKWISIKNKIIAADAEVEEVPLL